MKMRALIAVSLFLSIATADAQPSGVDMRPSGRWTQAEVGSAPTPPMGWNSWNTFGVGLSEAKILGSAQAIHNSGLEAQGYRSINIDDGWWLRRRLSDGRMQVRTNLFPSAAVGGSEGTSLRPFTDHLHAMGFKAGKGRLWLSGSSDSSANHASTLPCAPRMRRQRDPSRNRACKAAWHRLQAG